MNRYEEYLKNRPRPSNGKIKPWGKRGLYGYLIPYEYGHSDNSGIPTDGGFVWWVSSDCETARSLQDPDQTPFTIDDLDLGDFQ